MVKMLRKKIGLQYRSVSIERASVDKEKRTVRLSFSSETPVERWWGNEILSHDPGCCNLARLLNSAPLLDQHDNRRQIGVVESAEIGEDKKGRATVRFSQSPMAQEIFQDVQDGIRSKVSVGYLIEHMVMEEMDGDPGKDDDAEATYRADRWTPYEISLVSIPADDTVGVGRSIREGEFKDAETLVIYSENMFKTHPSLLREAAPADGNGGVTAPAVLDARNSEKNRVKEILAIGTRFRKVAEANDAIEKDTSIEAFRKLIMDKLEMHPAEANIEADTQNRVGRGFDVGELFTNNELYRKALTGGIGHRRQLNMDCPLSPYEIALWTGRGAASILSQRVPTTPAASTGLTSIQKLPEVVMLGLVPMRVADLMMPGETGNTTIRYIQETTFTNAADAVAENASIPEMNWELGEVDAGVHKIGTVGRVTDELFADYPAVRSYIDQRLAYAVGIKEDSELLNGTGAGAHIKGLLNFAGIQNEPSANSVSPIDAFMKALVKVRTVGWAIPSAFIMNPLDWQSARLAKDKNGQYLFGGPSTGPYGVGPYTVSGFMWGLPVIETTSIAQGTVLAGAFNQDSQIFRRIGLVIDTTNSDASDFQFNRIAIRATTRLALACYRPLSFCTITGVPAPGQ